MPTKSPCQRPPDRAGQRPLRTIRETPMPLTCRTPRRERRRVERAIASFAKTPRTEEAFFLRFEALPKTQRAALRRFWLTDDHWRIFRKLFRLYAVKRGATAAEQRRRRAT